MERLFTILFTGVCIAPLFFLAGAWAVWSQSKGPADQSIAYGYGGLMLGTGAAIIGFLLAAFLSHSLIAKGYLRPIQIADLGMFIGWMIVLIVQLDKQPRQLNYADHKPILYIEVRAQKSLLDGKSIDKVVEIHFSEVLNATYRAEQIRDEGKFSILPWYGYIYQVKDWDAYVYLHSQRTYFQMNLPRRPDQSTDWSDWISPTPHADCETPAGLSIRYRFRLITYQQDP